MSLFSFFCERCGTLLDNSTAWHYCLPTEQTAGEQAAPLVASQLPPLPEADGTAEIVVGQQPSIGGTEMVDVVEYEPAWSERLVMEYVARAILATTAAVREPETALGNPAAPQTSVPTAAPFSEPRSFAEGELPARAGDEAAPVDMLLFCPDCGMQHVDEPEHDEEGPGGCGKVTWGNPPHRSHLCHYCGGIWRPADVPTNGVAKLQTRGKADSWEDGQAEPAMHWIRAAYNDAAAMAEAEDPRTGDWMRDDPHEVAAAIRKRGDETVKEFRAALASTPAAPPHRAWQTQAGAVIPAESATLADGLGYGWTPLVAAIGQAQGERG